MNTVVRTILSLSMASWITSLFFVNALPRKNEIHPELYREPAQAATVKEPFTVRKEGVDYTLTPLFNYELYGLLVTYHNSSSFIDNSHEKWKDYLNVRDISVIWGYNIEADDYREVSFSHGDWTGYYEYDHPVKFDGKYFANMHILPGDEKIEKEVMRSRIGDQIAVKGYLVNYSHSGGKFTRTTSTVRDDTWNGACEIVYVTEFRILREANSLWRGINRYALITAVCCLLLLIGRFMIDAQKT